MDANPILAMRSKLEARFGGRVVVNVTCPPRCGSWFLDVYRVGKPPVVVEWTADGEFRVSTPTAAAFADVPREAYSSRDAAFDRVVGLVESGGNVEGG